MLDTIKTYNDSLSLVIIGLIFSLWIALGTGILTLPGEIVGATITVFALVTNFYFRKAPPVEQ